MYSGAVSIVDTGTSTLLQLAPDCEFSKTRHYRYIAGDEECTVHCTVFCLFEKLLLFDEHLQAQSCQYSIVQLFGKFYKVTTASGKLQTARHVGRIAQDRQ